MPLQSLADLHRFAIQHPEPFWKTFLDWTDIPWSGSSDRVLVGRDVESARFFPDVRLNYAEILLRPLPTVESSPALTSVRADGTVRSYRRSELRAEVGRVATALASVGLTDEDRVVAIAPNNDMVTIAALGAVALGATLSSATPDVGIVGLLSRFQQVEPAVLMIDRSGSDSTDDSHLSDLLTGLPSLRAVVLLDEGPVADITTVPVYRLSELTTAAAQRSVDWPRLPFDHPLFVMFSSGTTGPPKAIVHGAGGTAIEHIKEHRIHGDLRAGETLYFHTTTAWMMWNWQLSALAVGAHIVLYDGPITGPETLWGLAAEHEVNHFGTSPAYLQMCQDAGYSPRNSHDLTRLTSILSTGSVLHDWQFDWVTENIGQIPLRSISGGTDIIGCFVLGDPDAPVRTGRCQAVSLGYDVAAVDDDDQPLVASEGDLVCRRPFPSRPLGFLRDPDGTRFHDAYFATHKGMWTHGDRIDIAEDGSVRLHGRTDGVLNIDGVRIGPSEIYRTVRTIDGVTDAMAVEQRDPARAGRTRMVLLLVLAEGVLLDGRLEREIRQKLRRENSAAHVPSLVIAVPELPYTHNGKRSERAARDATNGDEIANEAALRNPACLAHIRDLCVVAGRSHGPQYGDGSVHSPTDSRLDEVLQHWHRVLGFSGSEPHDNFFDLGGSSRAAIDLLRRIKITLGEDIGIREFYDDPTPRGLARLIIEARNGTSDLLLRAGRGRAIHFFCDAWGQFNSFRSVVQALDTTRPVVGVAVATADDQNRRRRVHEVVDDAVTAVRTAQQEGPYTLLGYSYGGLLAYETAARLRSLGHDVGYVGLIDVAPPTATLRAREAQLRRWAERLERVKDDAPRFLARNLSRLVGRRAPEEEDSLVMLDALSEFDAQRLADYDGFTVYYEAEESVPFVGNQLSVWRRSAPNLVTATVPGHHDTLLSERFAPALAARISATLR